MAYAEKKLEQEEVITLVDVTRVQLNLSVEEANLVHDILMMAGGCPERSRRRIADDVKKALRAAGITGGPHDEYLYPMDLRDQSGIYFKEQ
jgi:hypothetical protein